MRSALRPFAQPPASAMRPAAQKDAVRLAQSQGGTTGAVSSPVSGKGPLCDWLDSQTHVLSLWLDRLIAQGDPDDLISMIHRQQAWLELMRERVGRE